MPSSGPLKIGVMVPIKNPKFRWGHELSGTFAADHTVMSAGITMDVKVVVPGWDQVFRKGDVILLGPSTYTGYTGSKEYVKVSTITNGTFTAEEDTAYRYSSGDPIAGIGTNLPSYWYPWDRLGSHAWALANLSFDGIFDDRETNITRIKGVSDVYRFLTEGWSDRGTLYYQGSQSDLEPRARYRIGFYYQVLYTGNTGGSAAWNVSAMDGSQTFLTEIFTEDNPTTGWTGFLSEVLTPGTETPGTDGMSGTPTQITDFYVQIGYASLGAAVSVLSLDHFFMCHALDTTYQNQGMYDIEWLPAFGSVAWADNLDRKTTADNLNRTVFFDPTARQGRHNRKRFSCSFAQAPASVYENLDALNWWQSQGCSLILKTNETRYGQRFPPVLIGKMGLTGFKRDHWHQGRVSFNFTFTED